MTKPEDMSEVEWRDKLVNEYAQFVPGQSAFIIPSDILAQIGASVVREHWKSRNSLEQQWAMPAVEGKP